MKITNFNISCRSFKLISVLILIVFLTSCSNKHVEIPEDVINKKEMTGILTDIHIAQSAYSGRVRTDTSLIPMNDYVSIILKHHEIKKEDFLNSLKFYSAHPELLQEVYDSVVTELSRLQGEITK